MPAPKQGLESPANNLTPLIIAFSMRNSPGIFSDLIKYRLNWIKNTLLNRMIVLWNSCFRAMQTQQKYFVYPCYLVVNEILKGGITHFQ